MAWKKFWATVDWTARADFVGTIVALFFDWKTWAIALFAGGVVSLWAAIEQRSPLEILIIALIAIACVAIIIAFLISLIQHVRRRPKSVLDPQKTDLTLSMLGGNVFKPSIDANLTTLALDVRVWNNGQSSIISEWSLIVVPVNQTPAIGQYTPIDNIIRVGGKNNSVVLRPEQDIGAKTSSVPVTETPIEGIAMFHIAMNYNNVVHQQTCLEVTIKDKFGTPKTFKKIMGEWLRR
jgi:hypothetical protein